MKYWRGYVVAAIFAAITAALVAFAKAHGTLVDMVYPYMTRIIISSLADWSSGVSFCVWNVMILVGVALLLTTGIFVVVLRWNPIQMTGWALAVVTFFTMCSTALFGLNDYTGPLSEDVRLTATKHLATEINDAAIYFRNQANALAEQIDRESSGKAKFSDFEKMALQAGDGFKTLTYKESISIFAGSTAPVKAVSLSDELSKTIPLTGESLVDPNSPEETLPFIICMEMSRRMSISDHEEAMYASFLACSANSSVEFRYSGYLMAYALCYEALETNPTSTAQACAKELKNGNSANLTKDMRAAEEVMAKLIRDDTHPYDAVDLLTSWYEQEFVTPLHQVEEKPFDPFDPTQVDLSYTVPTPTKLEAEKK